MLAAGYVANLAAGWYRVSSFEGASGYFVVGLALLGLPGGMIVGIVTARMVATIAQRFDAALATHRYDHLFAR
jgi:hypothetical protein